MKTTAHEFRKKPYDVYLDASKGNTVTINHDRYKDLVFELTARDREPLKPVNTEHPLYAQLSKAIESNNKGLIDNALIVCADAKIPVVEWRWWTRDMLFRSQATEEGDSDAE